MQHIPKAAARRIPVAPEFTILEYGPLGEGVANGTVAEVSGRYPQCQVSAGSAQVMSAIAPRSILSNAAQRLPWRGPTNSRP